MKVSEVDLDKEWVKELAARRQATKKARDAKRGFYKKSFVVTIVEHNQLKECLEKIRAKK